MRPNKSHILSSCNKAHCVCDGGGGGGGHKAQFNSSIQASTFQMLIAVSSPSPPLPSSHHASLPFLLKARLPPQVAWEEWTHKPPRHSPTCIHHGVGGDPPQNLSLHLSLSYSIAKPPVLRDAPFEAWFKDNFHCF